MLKCKRDNLNIKSQFSLYSSSNQIQWHPFENFHTQNQLKGWILSYETSFYIKVLFNLIIVERSCSHLIHITVSIIKSHVFQTDYKASDLSYSSSLLDSDPAKITSAIIGYSDIRLFDLPVSIKQKNGKRKKANL